MLENTKRIIEVWEAQLGGKPYAFTPKSKKIQVVYYKPIDYSTVKKAYLLGLILNYALEDGKYYQRVYL